jgi:DNA-binding CsgD family transcriptional regulator
MNDTIGKVEVPKLLPVSVAILDRSGTIIGVNHAWKEFGLRSGLRLPASGVGASYLRYCDSLDSSHLGRDLRSLLAGKVDLVTRIYPCHSPTAQRWFFMIALPLASYDRSGVAILHVDLTPFLSGTHEKVEAVAAASSTVAGSVAYSSLEALSSQLASMLGGLPAHPTILEYHPKDADGLASVSLSKRQLEILGLLAEGRTNTEIARALSRSPNTVKLHVSAILRHLNVKSRTQAALLASKIFAREHERKRLRPKETVGRPR